MIRIFFKMIRWPNLLIVVLAILLMFFFIIRPGLALPPDTGLSALELLLLIGAVLFIAMGGYVMNDLADVSSDMINKPGKNVFESTFSEKSGKLFYRVFMGVGVLMGTVLSFLTGEGSFSLIFLLTAGLLWFYAERYQCQPLMGNAVVAFLSALSFGLVWLFQVMALRLQHVYVDPLRLHIVNNLVLIYMGFAFWVSLLREIVKDMEDEKGDAQTGCRTFPVVYGLKRTKSVASFVNLVGLFTVFYVQWLFYQWHFVVLFLAFFVIDLFFGIVLLQLINAKTTKQLKKLSLWIKLLMLVGILSMALFYFE